MENRWRGGGEKRGKGDIRKVKKVEERVKGMEVKIEKWDKEERKRNIIIER